MDRFAGLDVSVKETSVCIVDDTGKIVREGVATCTTTKAESFMKTLKVEEVYLGGYEKFTTSFTRFRASSTRSTTSQSSIPLLATGARSSSRINTPARLVNR